MNTHKSLGSRSVQKIGPPTEKQIPRYARDDARVGASSGRLTRQQNLGTFVCIRGHVLLVISNDGFEQILETFIAARVVAARDLEQQPL
jgi:hypothetical protein